MGDVDDDTLLSKMSIPGTHNSCACYFSYPSVRCQKKEIKHQLQNGVRFLDIRTSPPSFLVSGFSTFSCTADSSSTRLSLVHGDFSVSILRNISLTSVLSQVYEFLKENSSETVIVSIMFEGPPSKYTSTQLSEVLYQEYILPMIDTWYLDTSIPKLGDVRSKAILFRRFSTVSELETKYGIAAPSWTYNTPHSVISNNGTQIAVQDFCDIKNKTNMNQKKEYIQAQIKRASSASDGDSTLYINFSSGSWFWNITCWPKRVANAVYPAIMDALNQTTNGVLGVIILDFVNKKQYTAAKAIYSRN
ncbi:hypothetical protein V1511DRAFT_520967 [Dipodascopsis uninucleata]